MRALYSSSIVRPRGSRFRPPNPRRNPCRLEYLIPSWVSTENYRAAGMVALELPAAARKSKSSAAIVHPSKPAVMRAMEWRRLLESGEVGTRADIARLYGVSRARVTQALRAVRSN